MAIKKNLKERLNRQTEEEELEIFEEATNREIRKKKEPRTAQFNALLPPSLFRNINLVAEGQNLSVNEIVNRVLEKYVDEHPKDLEKGRKIRELKDS